MKSTAAAVLVLGTALSTSASAEMLWSDFSLSYLYGSHYSTVYGGEDDRTYITVEHASGHSWGDNFLFIDRQMDHGTGADDDEDSSYYGELSPRLSFGKISGADLSFGPISDVLLASTWEAGDGFDNLLYGLGFDLDIPGFRYFNVNLYKVNNDLVDDDEQLTLTWAYPFSVASQDFLIDGFLDWSSAADDHKSEMNFTPQIKWNAGKLMGLESPLYVGMEYAYWNNKYGNSDGKDERSASLLVKWHF